MVANIGVTHPDYIVVDKEAPTPHKDDRDGDDTTVDPPPLSSGSETPVLSADEKSVKANGTKQNSVISQEGMY